MKKVYLFLIGIFVFLTGYSQNTPYVKYIYDAAGNRTTRLVIVMKSAEVPEDSVQTPEPVVDKFNDIRILLYPNPTTGILKIDIQNQNDGFIAEMYVYSMDGKLLKQNQNITHTVDIDFSTFPPGIYLVQLSDGKGKREWEIVKQ